MPIVPLLDIFAEMASPPDKRAAVPFDSVAVAGFFGGDSAVAGMATANLTPGRRWVGWYNNPGSYEIAKRYGPLRKAKLIDGLFPGGEHNPARLFKLDGREGPPFIGAHSGTVFQRSGHLAHLTTSKAADMDTDASFEGTHGRAATSLGVTIVNMQHFPELSLKESSQPPLPPSWKAAWSVVPIAVSIGASGIVAHGFACYVIGSGKLTFTHPKPAANAPPGDGVLKGDREWVILVGSEGVVNTFTRGRFLLQYGTRQADEAPATKSGSLSLRRRSDASAIMFIATVLASWTYNTYLSSLDRDRDKLQMEILSKELHLRKEHMHKYELNTFTAAVAFACFAWKQGMAEKLKVEAVGTPIKFSKEDLVAVEGGSDKELLKTFFDDAEDAWAAVRGSLQSSFCLRASLREPSDTLLRSTTG
ncbi:hypothetical protein V8D89_006701 [Ganoderma adspersum]